MIKPTHIVFLFMSALVSAIVMCCGSAKQEKQEVSHQVSPEPQVTPNDGFFILGTTSHWQTDTRFVAFRWIMNCDELSELFEKYRLRVNKCVYITCTGDFERKYWYAISVSHIDPSPYDLDTTMAVICRLEKNLRMEDMAVN